MNQLFLPLADCIVLESLPSVAIHEHATLPKQSGIYFVLGDDGAVQYIGRTVDLQARWKTHHRLAQYRENSSYRIAWLTISNPDLLPAIEQACMDFFNPKDNGMRSVSNEQEPCTWKRHINFRLSEEACTILDQYAHAYGLNRSAMLEVAIRQYTDTQRLRRAELRRLEQEEPR